MMKLQKYVLMAAAALGLMIGSGLWASGALANEADEGTIHSCVNNNSHLLKVVDAGTACEPESTALDWNQQGIQGPAGPVGPVGPAGAAGVTDVQYVTGPYVSGTVSRAFCPAGSIVAGGGAISSAGIQQSYPISDSSGLVAWGNHAIGWQAGGIGFQGVQAFVVCLITPETEPAPAD